MVLADRDLLLTRLRRLAKTGDDGAPVVSLYLDTWCDEGRKRDAIRVFVKSKLQNALALSPARDAARSSLERDAERIRGQVDELLAPGAGHRDHGFALFASAERGLWETIVSPQPFDNELVVRQVPYLIPLARMIDDYQTALVCQVDSRSARILEIVFGGLATQETIDHPDVPGRHHQGGWSQMRFQRRIDWAREQHVREVAEALVKLADQDHTARLFLSGPPEPLGELKAALPRRVVERKPVEIGLGISTELPAVLRTVLGEIEALEREEETGRARSTLDAALAGQLAVTGPEDVVAAAVRGAVSLLVVLHGLKLSGWRCAKGCLIGSGAAPASCPVCGAQTADCDLTARVVERVLADGGDVDLVHESSALAAAGGIAARLRFAM
ncbi:MAG: Vms1/Ankzf1 family peptidyl-tRNA hydrolase [Acidobacteriota bacterium]|nr:Vms1/Ankzf1 family peptidyl-tRNA hydrolase [Acidobacteriota bacterium]